MKINAKYEILSANNENLSANNENENFKFVKPYNYRMISYTRY
jgi:hypothetical protein